MDIQIGDKVRFLNAVGGGKVTGFQKGGIVLVEDEDGFDIPVRTNEVVVVPADNKKAYDEAPKPQADAKQAKSNTKQTTFGTQPASQGGQPAAFASAQAAAEHEAMEKRIIQLEMKVHDLTLRLERLESAQHPSKDKQSPKRNHSLPFGGGSGRGASIIEVDLHIDELLDTTAGMSAADMKAYQLKVFRETMEANKSKKGQRIVFIHGNGEGVLRKAIIDELKYAYKTCEWQDASFQQYGFGATMVIVH